MIVLTAAFACAVPRAGKSAFTPSTPEERRWTDECTEFEPEGGHCPEDFPREEAQAACEQGNACACMKLGGFLGCRKASRAAATDLFQKACDGNLVVACGNLGVIVFWGIQVPADKPRGLALWQKACDGGWVFACRNIADVLEKGDTVPRDAEAAARYRAKAETPTKNPPPR